jgi:hypothetical protein
MPERPGLLAVWNDIAAEDEADFNAWYVEEHVPERLGIPGILSARRYRDAEAPLSYAAIYDTESLATLQARAAGREDDARAQSGGEVARRDGPVPLAVSAARRA